MLSPACITREIYQNNMKKLAGKFCSCDDKEKLCPACSLFGTVQKDFAYSSKIRFTDLECKSKIENEEEVIINKGNVENCYDKIITLPEMSSPKITSTEFYMKRPNNGAVFWTWDYYISANGKVIPLEKPELNGRKFYWHNLKDNIPENMGEGEELDNIVVLNDEDGNEVEFEFLDLIEYEGEEYVVLLPNDEEEEDAEEVLILKLEDTDSEDEESYVSVEDEEVLNKVFEIFKEKFKDEFNFVEE